MSTIAVTLTKDTFIAGTRQAAGTVLEVSRELAGALISAGMASKPDDWHVDPAKGLHQKVWRDLEGAIMLPLPGVNRPVLATYDGEIEDFVFDVADHYSPIKYHLPHEWAPGTDLYIHTHWSHNGSNISGTLQLEYHFSYAKGHSQQAFHASKILTHTIGSLTLANTPAKQHRIDEIQLSTPGGSATLLDTDEIEPDGLILMHFNVLQIPTITGGAAKPFIHYVDCHLQVDRWGTPQKSPNFYVHAEG